jgi:hypothetical protein
MSQNTTVTESDALAMPNACQSFHVVEVTISLFYSSTRLTRLISTKARTNLILNRTSFEARILLFNIAVWENQSILRAHAGFSTPIKDILN